MGPPRQTKSASTGHEDTCTSSSGRDSARMSLLIHLDVEVYLDPASTERLSPESGKPS